MLFATATVLIVPPKKKMHGKKLNLVFFVPWKLTPFLRDHCVTKRQGSHFCPLRDSALEFGAIFFPFSQNSGAAAEMNRHRIENVCVQIPERNGELREQERAEGCASTTVVAPRRVQSYQLSRTTRSILINEEHFPFIRKILCDFPHQNRRHNDDVGGGTICDDYDDDDEHFFK